jgi:hypothetical protein
LATNPDDLLHFFQIRDRSRIGEIIEISQRDADQVGLKAMKGIVEINRYLMRKAEIHDFNLMAFLSYCPGDISQAQRKDGKRHPLTVDGDQ